MTTTSDRATNSPDPLPTRLNLGCGPDYRDGWHNVDRLDRYDPDHVADLTETPWELPSDHFHRILCAHMLEHIEDQQAILAECERILIPGGLLEVRYPIGQDFIEDPDHVADNRWDWQTPERLCGKQPWDDDCGLEVVGKAVDIWSHEPGWLGDIHERYLEWRADQHGDGRWQFQAPGCFSGEFRVHFRKPTEGGE